MGFLTNSFIPVLKEATLTDFHVSHTVALKCSLALYLPTYLAYHRISTPLIKHPVSHVRARDRAR